MKLTALFALPVIPPAQATGFVATARPRVFASLSADVQPVHGVRMAAIPTYKPPYVSASERCPG